VDGGRNANAPFKKLSLASPLIVPNPSYSAPDVPADLQRSTFFLSRGIGLQMSLVLHSL